MVVVRREIHDPICHVGVSQLGTNWLS
jgi:hypothetical protein